MDISTILWPTDLSEASRQALPWVETLAAKLGARVHVPHVVVDNTRYDGYYGHPHLDTVQAMHEWELRESRQRLENLCQERLGGWPGWEVGVAIGSPAAEILKAASSLNAGLIVMTPHGQGGMDYEEPYVLGGVTDKVVRQAPVPVLVVNPARPARA